MNKVIWSCGVVVITSALHAEGPQFDPGRDQKIFLNFECNNSNLVIESNYFSNHKYRTLENVKTWLKTSKSVFS